MTPRYLSRIFLITLPLMSAFSYAASDDEMLRAFSEAAHAKPFLAVEPTSKPKAKSADQKELTRLRARINQLEEQRAESTRDKIQEALKTQQQESKKKLAALEAENQQQAKSLAKLAQELKAAQQQVAEAIQRRTPHLPDKEAENATLQLEKQQLTEEVSKLKQALKEAERQNKLLSDTQKNAETLKDQRIENDKKLAALDAEKKQQALKAAELRTQLDKVQEAVKRNEAQLKAQHDANSKQLNQQLQAAKDAAKRREDALKQHQEQHISALSAELDRAKKQAAIAAPPKSEAERDGYMLGQSIASNAVVQLQMAKDSGINVNLDQIVAGFATQLTTGTSTLSGEEMSRRYSVMQEAINKNMDTLIAQGYEQLNQQSGKRKTLVTQNGVRWYSVKAVDTKLIPEQQVQVSVKISTLKGKVINDFADDKVMYDHNLPALLHDGMSLTGRGGAVEGWALAKDIIEREPLPPWVAPYDVIHYQLAIK